MQRDIDLQSLRAGCFRKTLQPEVIENLAHPEANLRALHNVRRRSRVKIKNDRGRRPNVGGERERRMQFNRRQVRDPHQRGQIVGENEIDGAVVALAPDGRGLHPVRAMHGSVLFEEIFLVYSFRIALHGERPSGEMRHQHGRNADVEIHHLPLGETGGRIEDLVQIRELEFAALDFDDGGCGHGVLRATGRRIKMASSIDGPRKSGQWAAPNGAFYFSETAVSLKRSPGMQSEFSGGYRRETRQAASLRAGWPGIYISSISELWPPLPASS